MIVDGNLVERSTELQTLGSVDVRKPVFFGNRTACALKMAP
jgi:hypothetical protein